MNPSLDFPPLGVLSHFRPHTSGLRWQRVPSGFSGADVWRGSEGATPRVALKAWPVGTTAERVRQIHAWLTQAARLPFVPRVYANTRGQSVCVEAARVWDCCRWMPGAARTSPSADEVATACVALVNLHEAWAGETQRGPCPGVRNRLRVLAETEAILRAGPDALPPVSPQLDTILRRAVLVTARLAPLAVSELRPWEHRELTLQPCVRDLRGVHVLFEESRVGGIIDFGAMAIDYLAVDLARLLSDFAPANDGLFAAGLSAYRTVRPSFDAPDEFVRLLARTGTVCSVLGWLVRLAIRRESPTDALAVASRLDSLLARVASFARL